MGCCRTSRPLEELNYQEKIIMKRMNMAGTGGSEVDSVLGVSVNMGMMQILKIEFKLGQL